MADMYSISCVCGKTHEVTSGQAGTEITCACGKTVAVPSLANLRRQAGEPTASAEMLIEAKLQSGQLPEESHCLCCDTETEDVLNAEIICEKITEHTGGKNAGIIAAFFGLFAYALAAIVDSSSKSVTAQGRDVRFRVPLRICKECSSSLTGSDLRETLKKESLYQRLLEKYPEASVSVFVG